MLLVQQGSREVIDWSNGAERHGVVTPPEQIGTKDHSQVTVGHLIHLTVGRYLNTHTQDAVVTDRDDILGSAGCADHQLYLCQKCDEVSQRCVVFLRQ